MRTPRRSSVTRPARQDGFALILAILSLMLLTVLGLTLAATTTTEIQIATNYKWSQQAFANAEAGIEVGKRVLRNMDWNAILPAARGGTWTRGTPPDPPDAPVETAYRNFENEGCDTLAGVGYGAVLGTASQVYENVSNVPAFTVTTAPGASKEATDAANAENQRRRILGAFTLWVRRPVVIGADGRLSDFAENSDTLILTSEGTAPYGPLAPGNAAAGMVAANRAVRVMEARLSRTVLEPCGARAGQTGGSQSGANFASCVTITEAGLPEGLTGTGDELGGR